MTFFNSDKFSASGSRLKISLWRAKFLNFGYFILTDEQPTQCRPYTKDESIKPESPGATLNFT